MVFSTSHNIIAINIILWCADWLNNNSYLQAVFQLEVDTGRSEAKASVVLKKNILKLGSPIAGNDMGWLWRFRNHTKLAH